MVDEQQEKGPMPTPENEQEITSTEEERMAWAKETAARENSEVSSEE